MAFIHIHIYKIINNISAAMNSRKTVTISSHKHSLQYFMFECVCLRPETEEAETVLLKYWHI